MWNSLLSLRFLPRSFRQTRRRVAPPPTLQVLEDRTLPSSTTFAVIGDYGGGGSNEQAVANLVHSWNPDFIATTGDNNYPSGDASTIDANIGQYYHDYIYPY